MHGFMATHSRFKEAGVPTTNLYARKPLYSNSAVITGWLQSTRAQFIMLWFTVIYFVSKLITAINFHDGVFIWNYHVGIVVNSGSIGAFKF